jgi:N-acetylmuramoyl-L-alanine amidase
MITLAWYLSKVIICSGILFGYYFLALRNKTFHRWNRFYLLASIVTALTVPLIKIDVFQDNADKGTVIRVLQTINYGDEVVIEYNKNGFQIDSETIAATGYVMISGIFLSIFLIALFKIRRLRKRFPETKIKEISFINTNAKGTPFSFLNAIFWNNAIDLHSTQGQKIFNHELAHIKEKHSYDKIFLNVVFIFFWINPFFWLMRKELHMIHEFIADKESLEDNDLNAFAEMILQTVYPGQKFSIGNSFFYSPIKRRLVMLTKNKNPKVSYISRLLALPLAAIVFFAFTIKMKAVKALPLYNGKTITVVIDAGHGGEDGGAVEGNIKEKDLTFDIAKWVKELNDNKNINIVLSRDKDESISLKDRINFTNAKKADLFISIHINKEDKKNLHSGIDVLIPSNNNKYLNQSKLLGSAIMEAFRGNYPLHVADNLTQREKGLWVLNANQCPAVLIEAGFLSSQKDFDYLTKSSNQQAIARNILNGIENYAEQNTISNIAIETTDTIPSIPPPPPSAVTATYYFKHDKVDITYENGHIETMTRKEAKKTVPVFTLPKNNVTDTLPDKTDGYKIPSGTIIFADGKKISKDEMKSIPPNTIYSINVLKGGTAEKKYGTKGKNGVIEITTKKAHEINNTELYLPESKKDSIPNKIFTQVENEASFPGGHIEWQKYIAKNFQASLDSFTTADFGTCILRFIVNTDGTVSDVRATTMKGTQLAKTAVNAVKNGPKWIPASQNGHTVASYRLQPITLTNPNAFNKTHFKLKHRQALKANK